MKNSFCGKKYYLDTEILVKSSFSCLKILQILMTSLEIWYPYKSMPFLVESR
ncbi:MAG: hypothetical protein JTT12_00100 [Candidatus Brockarchaeota archaeon]|nr:hypothetical protein [Candidatus Brockarchaeota archaeon]